MKATLENLLLQAVKTLQQQEIIPFDAPISIHIDRSKDLRHGDFSSNVALLLAKTCRLPSQALAQQLITAIPHDALVEKIEIAGPGFINFFIAEKGRLQVVADIVEQGDAFGQTTLGKGQRVLLEYVSANPTGPLHVGHGRGAAFGASLANLLTNAGFEVSREYYVNDAGRQMNILAVSVWLRYLQAAGEEGVIFPANGYQGEYVFDIAHTMLTLHQRDYVHSFYVLSADLPPDEAEGGDKEIYIDALIDAAKRLLGEAGFALFHQQALQAVLQDIKEDLAEFGVVYDEWFSEQSLMDKGAIEQGIAALKDAGHTYEQEGALWFRAQDFGDEKDRVLVRANGQTTYFASDVAYHWYKYQRGFNRVIDVFGADHHGYVSRLKAAVKALGHDEQSLSVLLVQFAILYRGNTRVQMSTRSGSFVTLRELRQEVGNDAARFFYVQRKPEQHMDFDLDLAKSQSSDNPVYYIQYAHARICSVFRQLQERKLVWDKMLGIAHLTLLTEPHEVALIQLLNKYVDITQAAACAYEPHQLAYFLRELANGLHSYYNAVPLLDEQMTIRHARLTLIFAIGQVLRNGMRILGVSAPEKM